MSHFQDWLLLKKQIHVKELVILMILKSLWAALIVAVRSMFSVELDVSLEENHDNNNVSNKSFQKRSLAGRTLSE